MERHVPTSGGINGPPLSCFFLIHQQAHMHLNVLQLKSKFQLETMSLMQQHTVERKFDFKDEIWEGRECMVQTAQVRKTELDFQ